jgi:hypothetical protein
MSLCKYSSILGSPRKGIHFLRLPFIDIAAVDTGATFLASWAISISYNIPFVQVLSLMLLSGFLLHWIFCVKTRILSHGGTGKSITGTLRKSFQTI